METKRNVMETGVKRGTTKKVKKPARKPIKVKSVKGLSPKSVSTLGLNTLYSNIPDLETKEGRVAMRAQLEDVCKNMPGKETKAKVEELFKYSSNLNDKQVTVLKKAAANLPNDLIDSLLEKVKAKSTKMAAVVEKPTVKLRDFWSLFSNVRNPDFEGHVQKHNTLEGFINVVETMPEDKFNLILSDKYYLEHNCICENKCMCEDDCKCDVTKYDYESTTLRTLVTKYDHEFKTLRTLVELHNRGKERKNPTADDFKKRAGVTNVAVPFTGYKPGTPFESAALINHTPKNPNGPTDISSDAVHVPSFTIADSDKGMLPPVKYEYLPTEELKKSDTTAKPPLFEIERKAALDIIEKFEDNYATAKCNYFAAKNEMLKLEQNDKSESSWDDFVQSRPLYKATKLYLKTKREFAILNQIKKTTYKGFSKAIVDPADKKEINTQAFASYLQEPLNRLFESLPPTQRQLAAVNYGRVQNNVKNKIRPIDENAVMEMLAHEEIKARANPTLLNRAIIGDPPDEITQALKEKQEKDEQYTKKHRRLLPTEAFNAVNKLKEKFQEKFVKDPSLDNEVVNTACSELEKALVKSDFSKCVAELEIVLNSISPNIKDSKLEEDMKTLKSYLCRRETSEAEENVPVNVEINRALQKKAQRVLNSGDGFGYIKRTN